jgi:hypothetical protein
MAQTPPPGIDPVPTPPIQRGDRATFSARVDAFITWLVNAVTQFGATATNVYNNAVDAFASATTASTAATTATGAAQSASDSAAIAAVSATGLTASSTSSLAIGTGTKAFTVPAGKSFVAGIRVSAVNPSNPAQYMSGTVASYSGTTLTVTVDIVGGSGTVATWNISVTGQRGADGAMGPAGGVAGGSLTGALNERQGNEVALTSTPDIWGTGGNMFRLTGSGDILGYTDAPQIGAKREYLVTGNPRLVESANHIVSGGTQTLSPGDIVDVRSETLVSRFRVTVRRRNGLAAVSPAQTMTLLGTATVSSAVANIDFLNAFTADYDRYEIVVNNAASSAAANFLAMRIAKAGAVDAGSNYLAANLLNTQISISPSDASGVREFTGVIEVLGANSDRATIVRRGLQRRLDTAASLDLFSAFGYQGTGPLTGFRLYWGAGANFTAGTVRVYGIRNVAGVV